MGKAQTNEKHPKGFYACCITFMFERLAFYGAKPILLLFLITATLQGGLGIERTDAAVMAANLTAYTYMAPLIGGIISDRWLGARYAISLGYIIMAIGYLVGWKATGPGMVNLMIILVSIGTGLFKGNLNALIGRQYQNKELLDAAFWSFRRFTAYRIFVSPLIQKRRCAWIPSVLLCGIDLVHRWSGMVCAELEKSSGTGCETIQVSYG